MPVYVHCYALALPTYEEEEKAHKSKHLSLSLLRRAARAGSD